jgi:hypothetical protein
LTKELYLEEKGECIRLIISQSAFSASVLIKISIAKVTTKLRARGGVLPLARDERGKRESTLSTVEEKPRRLNRHE